MTDHHSPTRVIAYADGHQLDASRAFYTDVLGFEVAMEDPILGLSSPANRSGSSTVPTSSASRMSSLVAKW